MQCWIVRNDVAPPVVRASPVLSEPPVSTVKTTADVGRQRPGQLVTCHAPLMMATVMDCKGNRRPCVPSLIVLFKHSVGKDTSSLDRVVSLFSIVIGLGAVKPETEGSVTLIRPVEPVPICTMFPLSVVAIV